MGGNSRVVISFLFVMMISICAPVVETTKADANEYYPLSDIIANPYTLSGSSALAYSNDGSIIAAAFYQNVVIIDSSQRTFLRNIDLGNNVLELGFSLDDSILAIGLESPFMSTLAMSFYDTSTWERVGVNEEGNKINDISFMPDSDIFAASNETGYGVNEYSLSQTSAIINTYGNQHSDTVICVDHSPDGQFLVTGGLDGNVFVWDRQTQDVVKTWTSGNPISDCAISPDGTKIVWASSTLLQVRSLPDFGYVTDNILSGNALQLEWSTFANELWVMQQSSEPSLIIFDNQQFEMINLFLLGHRVNEFTISPAIDEFIVSSSSKYVSFFRQNKFAPYSGMVGLDTDEDGTPDSHDSDDDGDGISDEFEYVCVEGSDCSINPDPDLIRRISISFTGNKITVIDKLQLNETQSAPIRDLASSTVNSDSFVDTGEAVRIEKMLCGGTDEVAISNEWQSALRINNTIIVSTEVRCDALLGLSGTEKQDSSTRIQVRWFIEISLSNEVPRPFDLQLDTAINAPQNTISQIIPNSPFTLIIQHNDIQVDYQSPLYPSDGTYSVYVPELAEPEPTIIDLTIEWLSLNYWIPLLAIISIVIISLFIVRRKNRIELDDYEFEEEDYVTTRRTRPIPSRTRISSENDSPGRPQPTSRPSRKKGRPKPIETQTRRKRRVKSEHQDPPVRQVRKVRSTRQVNTGNAPEGEEWDYGEHGAYWDENVPDAIDPYGEAKEIHDAESKLFEIASEFSSETQEDDQEISKNLDESITEDEEDEMQDALSLITGVKKDEPPKEVKGNDKSSRRKVKRRKK